jgi:hypothetical protein
MVWPWSRRKTARYRAVGRVRMQDTRTPDNDVVPLPGFRRYAEVLHDRPLLTPGQAERSRQRPRHGRNEDAR